jgi:hypothetical protein
VVSIPPPDLRYFGVHPKRPGIDFSAFTGLESVVWIHNFEDIGLEQSASIKTLYLWHYRRRSKTFAELQLPHVLEHLEINSTNPASLAGLPMMPHLRDLELHRCRNLASLEDLPRSAPRLERLIITTSGRVTEPEALGDLPHLRTALVNGKAIIHPRLDYATRISPSSGNSRCRERRTYHSAQSRLGTQESHATVRYAARKSPNAAMSSGSSSRNVTAAKISA